MRLLLPASLALLLLQQASASPPTSRRALRDALLAVEGDSVAAFEARWSRTLRRDTADRHALLSLGSSAYLTYRYERADSLLDRVVALRDGDETADYARLQLGHSRIMRGRFGDAVAMYQRALDGGRSRNDPIVEAEALLGMAGPRSRQVGPREALASVERAESLAAPDTALVANGRCQRGQLYGRLGDPRALGLAQSGAQLASRVGLLRQEARCVFAQAQIRAVPGDRLPAIELLGRAESLFVRSRDRASLASLLQWRGFLYNGMGRYGSARDDLTAALAEGQRVQLMNVVGWARINLGMIALGLGDRAGATVELRQAVAALESQGDQFGVATARGMLGGVARAAGDTAAARAAYRQVLAWANRTGDFRTQLNMHDALSSIAEMRREWSVAREELDTMRSIARTHGMGAIADRNFRWGRLALRQGDFATAERELRIALAQTGGSEHAWRYVTRVLLAEALLGRGNVAGAEAELTTASNDLDRWRATLTDQQMRVRAMEFEHGIDPDMGVATLIAGLARAGRVQEAFDLAERQRARALTDRLYRASAVQGDSAPGDGRLRATAAAAGPRRVVPDDSTALLEYVTGLGGEPTTLFVVTAESLTAHQLPPIDSLAADVNRFTALLEGDGDARGLGARLGMALLGSLQGRLGPGIVRLAIVPDGILARIPFDALLLPDSHYVLERFAVGLVPSAAALSGLTARGSGTHPVRLLALGDSRFAPSSGEDATAATVVYRSAFDSAGGLPRLAASAHEARQAARHAPSSEVRLRGEASEAWLRAAPLDSFRVLHFATHALVDDESPSRTALALAPGGGHDGFLGPADLAGLRLNADLVVLSACRTARGEVLRGEGVQGLTAPLLQAGARSIVATSWRIEDRAAVRIVARFYDELAQGGPVSEALRQAKLAALRSGAGSSEWAAFVALGDPTTRVPLVAAGAAALPRAGVVIAAGVLVVLAYGMMRKRRGSAAV